MGDQAQEAVTLNNIAFVYDSLGEKQKALDYYNQSLPLTRQVGDQAGEARTLNNIGLVYDSLGEKQKALDYYNQSLPLTRQVGDQAQEAVTLNNIGRVYDSLGKKQKALDYYNQSLPLRRQVGDQVGEAVTLNNIGNVYYSLGEKQKALDYYNQSLPLTRKVEDKATEAAILFNIAYLERDRKNLTQSLTQINAAIDIIENLRTKIDSQQLRASYFASVQNYYQFKIDLLMELHQQNPKQGYDAQALETNEQARARNLLEILTEANTDIRTKVDPTLRQQERTITEQLNAAEYRKYKLLNGQYTNKQLAEVEQQIETLLSQLDLVKAQIRQKSPAYAAITQPKAFTLNLQKIQQQVLDADTLLLEYSLGANQSYLWAVTKTSITTYKLPKRIEIETTTEEFKHLLKSEDTEVLNSDIAHKLSQILLTPVASQLGQKRLLIVADGVLQTIPFAALPIPASDRTSLNQPISYTPLLVEHEIVSLPSASTVAILRNELKGRQPVPKTLAVLADPVFSANDDRFQNKPQPQPNESAALIPNPITRSAFDVSLTIDRLPSTRQEANQILALVPENQRFSALDFTASRTTATSPNLAQYQIIHLATHGLLNTIHPELSGVVLSLFNQNGEPEDGFLRLNDIFNLNLPAELVVLSACQTGLVGLVQDENTGELKEAQKGEGIGGLTRGFMYAGAKRVVVSLWKVNDTASAKLMEKFYQKMLNDRQNPVAALRAAQLEMWQTEQWQAPYYWAAFIVQGEWN